MTDIFVFIFISAIDPLKMSYEYINNNVNNISNSRYILFFIKNLNKIWIKFGLCWILKKRYSMRKIIEKSCSGEYCFTDNVLHDHWNYSCLYNYHEIKNSPETTNDFISFYKKWISILIISK